MQKDVAAELAELEGLRSIIPILDQQADHATQTVQGKLQELHEQAEMRMQLDEHVDQLYGPGALGGGGAPPPYREQMLHELAREYAEVQKLRQEVRARQLLQWPMRNSRQWPGSTLMTPCALKQTTLVHSNKQLFTRSTISTFTRR